MARTPRRAIDLAQPFPRFALGVAAASLLAGCVASEPFRTEDRVRCTSYGFAAGTADFANCTQREALAREYRLGQSVFFGPGGFWGPGWGSRWTP